MSSIYFTHNLELVTISPIVANERSKGKILVLFEACSCGVFSPCIDQQICLLTNL